MGVEVAGEDLLLSEWQTGSAPWSDYLYNTEIQSKNVIIIRKKKEMGKRRRE
jgi:hypothetical protein